VKRIVVAPGDKYGELKIIREVESKGKRRFLCKCDCGQKAVIRLGHLRSGHTTSCGRCGIEFNGKCKTIVEWAREHGLHESTLRARLKLMSLAEALKRGNERCH
jgi:hypothetical protein